MKGLELHAEAQRLEEGKRLFVEFVETFLHITFQGVQNGFGLVPDQILFLGEHGNTLTVPIDTLLEPREIALGIIKAKIDASIRTFQVVRASA